VAVHENL